MEHTEIYEYILSRTEADLAAFGYKRSGKGSLFYRYSADKTVACGIEMQKSMYNYPGSYSFTFNLTCVGLCDLPGYEKKTLTLAQLKLRLRGFHAERIGMLFRGRDYWWNVTEETLRDCSLAEYYDKCIREDIEKSAALLLERAGKKEAACSSQK